MSKLVIILCATVFYASATLDVSDRGQRFADVKFSSQLDILNRKIANRHIDDVIEKVRERSAEVYQKVVSVGGSKTGEENLSVTVPLLEKVSNHFRGIRKLVNHWISVGRLNPIDDKKCHDYFADYATASNGKMMSLKKHVFYDVYHEATKWIGEILHLSNVKKNELHELKCQASTCTGSQCPDLSSTARELYNAFFDDTEKAFEYYKKMAEGQAVTEMFTLYTDYFDDMGELIIKKIYNCVQNLTELLE